MKFPFVTRKRLETELQQIREKLAKQRDTSNRAKQANEQLKQRIAALHGIQDELSQQMQRFASGDAAIGTISEATKRLPSSSNGCASPHIPFSWSNEFAAVYIEETWSTDTHLGVRGFALLRNGNPRDIQFFCEGAIPESIEWHDRPDLANSKQFVEYPKQIRCGFRAYFRRRAWHRLSFQLPQETGGLQQDIIFAGTGIAPTQIENPGISLQQFANRVNVECRSVLEIGSRVVSPGSSSKRQFFAPHVKYTGFDIHPDKNTDVVGDAHRLSSYFDGAEKFDAVFSISVFEHLAMPWLAALEVNKVLKIGGIAFTSTPFSWPLHEMPWDFWRYSHMGLRMLFPPSLGFETLEYGVASPCRILFEDSHPSGRDAPFHRAYGEANILVRKFKDYSSEDFRWNTSISEVLPQDSMYPKLKGT